MCLSAKPCKLASEFDPENRDGNVDYYVRKLDEVMKSFALSCRRKDDQKRKHLGFDVAARMVSRETIFKIDFAPN